MKTQNWYVELRNDYFSFKNNYRGGTLTINGRIKFN